MTTRWHFRIHGWDLGPVDFTTLQLMVKEQRLFADDEVRPEESAQWVPVKTIGDLFAEAAGADELSAMLPERDALADVEIIADDTPRRSRPARKPLEPILRLEDEGIGVDVPDTEAEWTCRVFGQTMGPLSWDQMKEMVATRQLGPTDRVRKGQAVAWVPAETIQNLFPKRDTKPKRRRPRRILSEDDVFAYLQPPAEREDEKPVTSHWAPQRNFGRLRRKSSRHLPPAAGESPSTVQPAAASPPPSVGPAPPSGRAEPSPFAAAVPSPRPFSPPRPVPRRATRRMGNPLTALGIDRDLLESAWKPLAAVAALSLLVVALIWGGSSLFGPGEEAGGLRPRVNSELRQ